MSIRLNALVEVLGGQLIGNGEIELTGIAPLDVANPTQISFLSNPKLKSQAGACRAAALIVSPKDHPDVGGEFAGACILVPNPYAYFARTAQLFAAQNEIVPPAGVHPSAVVDPSAEIDATASIGPHVVIEAGAKIGADAVIGAGCFIGRSAQVGAQTQFHPRVTFYAECRIGARGIVHSGAVIGADGFGFANEGGVYIKIPQTGAVDIADDVEIGANTTIDRGALSDTIIEEGVKLDNQIQIGHNCRIGMHTAIAGCVGIAGSAIIGKYCTVGGAAMIRGHLTIADRVNIGGGTLVWRSISEPGEYTGVYPIAKHADWEKSAAIVRNLSTMREKIRALEKTISLLSENQKS
jgi:UDP-3-O-[3-hydroxymyristoyl] glucosamine N-acyltransferase